VGLDEPDAEGPEHAAEVRRLLVPLQLFGEGPVSVVALKQIEAIAIELDRHAVLAARVERLASSWAR
jgi:hypothetical protein